MKIIAMLAIILLFSQGLMAEENTSGTEETVSQESSVQPEPIMVTMRNKDTGMFLREENPFKATELDLTDIEFYKFSDNPSYKPRNTILVGGVLPLIPIRSNIDASTEETGLFQKSISVLLYFKQKF
ncbi:MAG: hypothetical protein V3U21_00550 [Thermodesulfobacteriota bacterium]